MRMLTSAVGQCLVHQQSLTLPGLPDTGHPPPLKETNNTHAHAQGTFRLSLVPSAAAHHQSPSRFLASANHKCTLPKSNNPFQL